MKELGGMIPKFGISNQILRNRIT